MKERDRARGRYRAEKRNYRGASLCPGVRELDLTRIGLARFKLESSSSSYWADPNAVSVSAPRVSMERKTSFYAFRDQCGGERVAAVVSLFSFRYFFSFSVLLFFFVWFIIFFLNSTKGTF